MLATCAELDVTSFVTHHICNASVTCAPLDFCNLAQVADTSVRLCQFLLHFIIFPWIICQQKNKNKKPEINTHLNSLCFRFGFLLFLAVSSEWGNLLFRRMLQRLPPNERMRRCKKRSMQRVYWHLEWLDIGLGNRTAVMDFSQLVNLLFFLIFSCCYTEINLKICLVSKGQSQTFD